MRTSIVIVALVIEIGMVNFAHAEVVTEQTITRESIEKALSDVKHLEQERKKDDNNTKIPAVQAMDLSKVNSSIEKPSIDFVPLEETIVQLQQQLTMLSLQVHQCAGHFQTMKRLVMQQKEGDKKQIEQVTTQVRELKKQITVLQEQKKSELVQQPQPIMDGAVHQDVALTKT